VDYLLCTMFQGQFSDQCGNILSPQSPAQRIISLVPSQTELLFALGLDAEITGITKYCVHPTHWLSAKTIIGGTKNFDFAAIERLNPDLIIGNKEENYQEGILKLQERYPVWMSDIVSLPDAFQMIKSIGEITGKEEGASRIVETITGEFHTIQKVKPLSVLYLIWRKPWMAAAAGTFIQTMLEAVGLINCLASSRYPALTSEQIRELKPDLVFLSSEPYPFREKHIREIQELSPQAKVMLVDGEMFSWYGSRLAKAPQYFNSLPLPRI
jgi:ABC-type Fe3+-hydroxamate transport system substrate-binding protein